MSGKSAKAKQAAAHVEPMDSEQLATLLCTTRDSLYKAIQRGHVPPGTRVPGLGLRWRRDEIDAWLAKVLPRRDLPCA